jgi:hypothetical protein
VSLLPPLKQRAFLAAYAKCGNITRAAALAKVARSRHYEWMDDPDYAAAFGAAGEEACDLLESEARRRAVDGIEEPVVYQGELSVKLDTLGRRTIHPLTIRRYSDVLLIFLLKAQRPDKYRDNWRGELVGPNGAPLMPKPGALDLSNLTDDDLNDLRALAKKASARRGSGIPAPAEG